MRRLSSNGGTYDVLLIGGSIKDVNVRLAWASAILKGPTAPPRPLQFPLVFVKAIGCL